MMHFDTMAKAQDHLRANGWTASSRRVNRWTSMDRTCNAAIYALPNTEVVQVCAWER